jgi:hypothetical protein
MHSFGMSSQQGTSVDFRAAAFVFHEKTEAVPANMRTSVPILIMASIG